MLQLAAVSLVNPATTVRRRLIARLSAIVERGNRVALLRALLSVVCTFSADSVHKRIPGQLGESGLCVVAVLSVGLPRLAVPDHAGHITLGLSFLVELELHVAGVAMGLWWGLGG